MSHDRSFDWSTNLPKSTTDMPGQNFVSWNSVFRAYTILSSIEWVAQSDAKRLLQDVRIKAAEERYAAYRIDCNKFWVHGLELNLLNQIFIATLSILFGQELNELISDISKTPPMKVKLNWRILIGSIPGNISSASFSNNVWQIL